MVYAVSRRRTYAPSNRQLALAGARYAAPYVMSAAKYAARAGYKGAKSAYAYASKRSKSNKNLAKKYGSGSSGKKNFQPNAKASIPKRIRRLESAVANERSTVVYRDSAGESLGCSRNEANHQKFQGADASLLQVVLGRVPMFDQATPGTPNFPSLSADDISKSIMMKHSLKMTVVNAYQVPVKVRVYSCVTKDDSNIHSISAMANGLANMPDHATNPVTITDRRIYPSDAKQLYQLFNVKMVKNKILLPGEKIVLTRHSKKFKFDPSEFDNHSSEHQRSWDYHEYLVRVEGCLGHNLLATPTLFGSAQATIDVYTECTVEFDYDSAGAKYYQVRLAAGLGDIGATGVVGMSNVTDNQAYDAV